MTTETTPAADRIDFAVMAFPQGGRVPDRAALEALGKQLNGAPEEAPLQLRADLKESVIMEGSIAVNASPELEAAWEALRATQSRGNFTAYRRAIGSFIGAAVEAQLGLAADIFVETTGAPRPADKPVAISLSSAA